MLDITKLENETFKVNFPNGDKYEGQFKFGKPNGEGVLERENGVILKGTFKNGLLDGEGTLITAKGLVKEGVFTNGILSGRVVFTWPDGDKYVGECKDAYMHGPGRYTFSDGRWKEGTFVNDKLEGYGEFSLNKGFFYKGEFKDGYMHGNGTLKRHDVLIFGTFVRSRIYDCTITIKENSAIRIKGRGLYFADELILNIL